MVSILIAIVSFFAGAYLSTLLLQISIIIHRKQYGEIKEISENSGNILYLLAEFLLRKTDKDISGEIEHLESNKSTEIKEKYLKIEDEVSRSINVSIFPYLVTFPGKYILYSSLVLISLSPILTYLILSHSFEVLNNIFLAIISTLIAFILGLFCSILDQLTKTFSVKIFKNKISIIGGLKIPDDKINLENIKPNEPIEFATYIVDNIKFLPDKYRFSAIGVKINGRKKVVYSAPTFLIKKYGCGSLDEIATEINNQLKNTVIIKNNDA